MVQMRCRCGGLPQRAPGLLPARGRSAERPAATTPELDRVDHQSARRRSIGGGGRVWRRGEEPDELQPRREMIARRAAHDPPEVNVRDGQRPGQRGRRRRRHRRLRHRRRRRTRAHVGHVALRLVGRGAHLCRARAHVGHERVGVAATGNGGGVAARAHLEPAPREGEAALVRARRRAGVEDARAARLAAAAAAARSGDGAGERATLPAPGVAEAAWETERIAGGGVACASVAPHHRTVDVDLRRVEPGEVTQERLDAQQRVVLRLANPHR